MKSNHIKLFLVITFLWSWILWTPFVLPYFGFYEMTETLEEMLMLTIMLGAFGPLVAALVLSYKKGRMDEVKSFFKKCFQFRVHIKYYILAVLLGVGTTMMAYYITVLSGLSDLPKTLLPADTGIPMIIIIAAYTLMVFLLGGGQEEFGWRGYLQDLTDKKFGVIYSSLFVGLFWGLWHFPLWFIEGEGHAYYSFFLFLLFIVSWSVTIGVMYNISGKKMVIPWIMHTVSNVSVPLFPVLFMDFVAQPGYTVWVILNIVVAICITYWFAKVRKTTEKI